MPDAAPSELAAVATPERCAACEGRGTAMCHDLPGDLLCRLAGLGRTRTLKRGDTLIWEDEEADIVANVRSGILQLVAASAEGEEQILGLALPGDFVGQPFGGASAERVVALTAVSACVFRRSDFAALLADAPAVSQALLAKTFGDLRRARDWMQLIGRKSAEERVASLLWQFHVRAGAPAGQPVPLPLSRQQIADVLGLTIETVSRRMRGLDRDGVIALPGLRSFVVERADDLAALAA